MQPAMVIAVERMQFCRKGRIGGRHGLSRNRVENQKAQRQTILILARLMVQTTDSAVPMRQWQLRQQRKAERPG